MAAKLLILALTKRWTYVIIGAVLLIVGVVMFAGGHVYNPTEVSGQGDKYTEVSDSNNAYQHSEITLVGDSNTYTFNKNDFPGFNDNNITHQIDLWVEDPGSTSVIAIQFYYTDGSTHKFTSAAYDNPSLGVSTAHDTGIVFGVFGVLFLAFGLLWPIFPWGKKKKPAFAVAGYHAPVGVQTGLPQHPGYPPQGGYPQQPQYGYPPQQPAYPSQPMYPPQPGMYPPPPPGQGYPPQQSQPMYPPQQPQQPGQSGWGQPPRQ